MNDMSMACGYTCSLITIMSQPNIPCPNFDLNTVTQEGFDADALSNVAQIMARVISLKLMQCTFYLMKNSNTSWID